MAAAPRRSAVDPAAAIYRDRTMPPHPGGGALRLATWNINSVRLRLPLLKRLARLAAPDVICLQETKTRDDTFPAAAIAGLGYPHQVFHGIKGYNGVAILSRVPLAGPGERRWCGRQDARHNHVELPGAIALDNVYVPAGGDEPDPRANPKFAHKLDFVREQADWWTRAPRGRRILVGDLNIAPLEHDVWSHAQLVDVVSHTPVEVEALGRMHAAQGWVDAVRHLVPEPARVYTWWSYRNRDWRASDRGRRLDHVWLSPSLLPRLRAVHVLRGARDWPNPSDHVPVLIDLDP